MVHVHPRNGLESDVMSASVHVSALSILIFLRGGWATSPGAALARRSSGWAHEKKLKICFYDFWFMSIMPTSWFPCGHGPCVIVQVIAILIEACVVGLDHLGCSFCGALKVEPTLCEALENDQLVGFHRADLVGSFTHITSMRLLQRLHHRAVVREILQLQPL